MVIAPHGDDEVLMAGGYIVKNVELGNTVTVVFVRDEGTNKREIEQYENTLLAKEILGYKNRVPLDLTDHEIQYDIKKLVWLIEEMKNFYRPDIVIIPHNNDLHQDHRKVFEASSIVFRPHSKNNPKVILVGEILSSTNCGFDINKKFNPNYFVSLTEENINKKVKAMSMYEQEICENHHPRGLDTIYNTAKIHWSQSQWNINENGFSEAFEIIRWID